VSEISKISGIYDLAKKCSQNIESKDVAVKIFGFSGLAISSKLSA
jgi:hypothetical protein